MSGALSRFLADADHRTALGFVLAFVAMVGALLLPQAIGGAHAQKLSLFLPYVSMAAVFFLTGLWCLVAADDTTVRLPGLPARRTGTLQGRVAAAGACFVALLLLLRYCVGLGGNPGSDAIREIGRVVRLGEPLVQWTTAGASALSLMVVAQLMRGSFAVVQSVRAAGPQPLDGPHEALPAVLRCQRAVFELLQAGAVFAFVSTATLFLFFALADEVRRSPIGAGGTSVIAAASARGAAASSADGCRWCVEAPAAGPNKAAAVAPPERRVRCEARPSQVPASAAAWAIECTVPAEPRREPAQGAQAASLAFAVGVSFAGVLFLTLFTAGRAVDRAIGRVEERARWLAELERRSFGGAEWRKQQGLPESGLAQSVIQAVVLFAPTAAAGLAALLKG